MVSTLNTFEQTPLIHFYSDVANQLNTKVFLWGALVQALVLELKDGNLFILRDLAEKTTDNRLLRSALVEALVRFGEADRDRAEKFILELIGELTPPPRSFFAELVRLLRPVREDSDQAQPRKMIVVEAAMRLRLTGLLENLAVEPSPWLRNLAAQNIFYLWKQDHEAGLKVLDALSSRVRGKYGLPDLGAVESMLALIGAILGFEHKDPATLEGLSTIGRSALRRILYFTNLDKATTFVNRVRKLILNVAYNLVTGVVLKFALRTVGDWGQHAWASRAGMEHFFKLLPEQKQLVKSLIPFVDYEEPGFEHKVADMIKALEWGDQLVESIIGYAILGRGAQDFDKAVEITRQLTEYGLSFKPPCFWIGTPIWNFWQGAAHLERPDSDVILSLVETVTKAIQDNPALWVEYAQRDRAVPIVNDTRVAFVVVYLEAYYVFTKHVEIPEVIQSYLERAIKEKDNEYIRLYVQDFAGVFEMGYHQIAVAALKPVANYNNADIQKLLIEALVRARNYDPEYIEDILLRGEFPQETVDRVLANPTSERLTDLLTYQLLTIIYDLFILGPKTLRNELKWLLAKALELPSLQDFIVLIIREIFNIVLGEVVFSVPKDAPSRQMSKGEKIP